MRCTIFSFNLTTNSLAVDYDIQIQFEKSVPGSEICLHVKVPRTTIPQFDKIEVVACTTPKNLWKMQRPIFDVDSLACNNHGIYVWPYGSLHDAHTDRIGTIMNRIFRMTFSLYPSSSRKDNECTIEAIQSAIHMVRCGWTMVKEDSDKTAWNIARHTNSVADMCCAICQETFIADEVVVRLACGHCFHASCHRREGEVEAGGLCEWLRRSNACPCCRQEMS
jgi:hypothetical protein